MEKIQKTANYQLTLTIEEVLELIKQRYSEVDTKAVVYLELDTVKPSLVIQ